VERDDPGRVMQRSITTHPEKCTGCLRCALACSFRHTGMFNPMRARIHIRMDGPACDISFDDACTGCLACVGGCLYGALAAERQREGSA